MFFLDFIFSESVYTHCIYILHYFWSAVKVEIVQIFVLLQKFVSVHNMHNAKVIMTKINFGCKLILCNVFVILSLFKKSYSTKLQKIFCKTRRKHIFPICFYDLLPCLYFTLLIRIGIFYKTALWLQTLFCIFPEMLQSFKCFPQKCLFPRNKVCKNFSLQDIESDKKLEKFLWNIRKIF